MNKLLKEIKDSLDFSGAISRASSPNDLLPSRFEDKVGGELGKEFVVYLNRLINKEKYSPTKAEFIHVPKPGFATRPAALLTLVDRIVYEALVDKIKKPIEKKLVTDVHVMWPRADYNAKKRWSEFETAPLHSNDEYIVSIDVTAFYDSIDHLILEDTIVSITGEDDISHVVSTFLTKIMGINRGLPQGILASDTLATLYLQPLDSAMLRAGLSYWRHGDDIRISVKDISLGRKAIATAEIELRKIGLVLNSSKCLIQSAEIYESHLKETSKAHDKIKAKLYKEQEKEIEDAYSDIDVLQHLMERAGLGAEIQMALFYHQSITVSQVIETIKEYIQPEDVEIAVNLFNETIALFLNGENSLPEDQFHVRIKKSIVVLTSAKSSAAIKNCAMLIENFPEKTEFVCHYLISLSSLDSESVALQMEKIINSGLFLTAWQKAWIYRVMLACSDNLTYQTKMNIKNNCNDQDAHWLERVEGFKILSKIDELPFSTILNSWENAPVAYRPDLIISAVYLSKKCPQSIRFLEGIKQQPIEKVVARHCKSELGI